MAENLTVSLGNSQTVQHAVSSQNILNVSQMVGISNIVTSSLSKVVSTYLTGEVYATSPILISNNISITQGETMTSLS
ncbi:MAG: hypothetical protein QW815_00345 [Nitrososphaerota archaeon]